MAPPETTTPKRGYPKVTPKRVTGTPISGGWGRHLEIDTPDVQNPGIWDILEGLEHHDGHDNHYYY